MASFKVLSEDRVTELTRRAPTVLKLDLSPYRLAIRDAVTLRGGWGEVTLAPNDTRRTEKRRLSIAGRLTGYAIKWHSSSTDTVLVYRAVPFGEILRRARRPATEAA